MPWGNCVRPIITPIVRFWWLLAIAVYAVSALYEGYLTVPGFGGHSLSGLLQRIMLLLPLVVFIRAVRGDRGALMPLVLLGGWLAVAVLTYLYESPHSYYALYYVWSQVGGVLLVAAFWYLAPHGSWMRWTITIAVGLYVAATLAVAGWEMATAHHLAASRSAGAHPSRIPTAFYFDPNNLAVALVLLFPFVLYLGVLWKRRLAVLTVPLLAGMVYVLIKTGSRGGELALILEGAAIPWVLPRALRRVAWRIWLGIAALLVALVVVLQFVPPGVHLPFALTKIQHMAHLLHHPTGAVTAQQGPGSTRIRLALLQSGWAALSHHPWGLGPRGAEHYYAYWVHHPSPYNTYGVIDPHNMWLENAMDFGWPGLVLYALFYFGLLGKLFALRNHRDAEVRYVAWAGFPAMVGFLVGSLSPSSVMIGFAVMWLVYGIGVGGWHRATAAAPRFRSRRLLFESG